jgi:DNA-binding beta-propeller fold protein YncE
MRTALLCTALLLGSVATPAMAGTAWVSSNHIQVVDLDTAQIVGRIPLQEFIHDMEFSPDGASVYVGSSQGFRVASASELRFVSKVADGGTLAVTVDGSGAHVATLTKAPDDACLAARKAGQPLPTSTITVYSTLDMGVKATWSVPGGSRDLAISPDGSRLFLLEPPTGYVRVYDAQGAEIDAIDVAPGERSETGHPQGLYSGMEVSPDGTRVMIPVTTENASSIIDVDLGGSRAQQVVVQDLGHRRRIQGIAWDEDGSGVYVTAVNHVVKFSDAGLPLSWQKLAVNYVDVAPVPGASETVMVAPTFSSKRRSGGVSLIDAEGNVVRSVELPDMSPFHVAVSPK